MTPWPTGVPKGPRVREYEDFAMLVRMAAFASGAQDGLETLRRADAALIECAEVIERLCVCGTCGESRDVDGCFMGECWPDINEATSEDDHATEVAAEDHCHFTPSRWTPYWDAEQKAADA